MKKIFGLVAFLFSCSLFSQNYHYAPHSNYFDNIGVNNILENKITKIEINIDDYQLIKAYFDKKARINKIEVIDKKLNKTTSITLFNWNSESNYLFNSLGYSSSKDRSYMTKEQFNYLRKGDDKMSLTGITQYWVFNERVLYAEKYNIHNYLNTITRSLNSAIEFTYSDNNQLKSIKNRKVTSQESSAEQTIMYPKHHIQENTITIFNYESFGKLKTIEKYFLGEVTSINEFKYSNKNLSKIVNKTNYNNSETNLFYSDKLITRIEYNTNSYPDPLISKISYYSNGKKLDLYKPSSIIKSIDEDKSRLPQNKYKTIVNLNLRSNPNISSQVQVMIPIDSYVKIEKEIDTWNTFEIKSQMITSNWVYIEYGSFKGWVFKGGLKEIKN